MVLARVALLSRRLARHASTRALMHYQSDHVPRSLTSTGRVGTRRDLAGSDAEFFGVDPVPTRVDIEDGRGAGFTLDANGFCLVGHASEHIDPNPNPTLPLRTPTHTPTPNPTPNPNPNPNQVGHAWEHIDYYDNASILNVYYAGS